MTFGIPASRASPPRVWMQAVAGHANPLITLKRYSHLLDARISEAAERVDPAAHTRNAEE
jgi:hypothetical protein